MLPLGTPPAGPRRTAMAGGAVAAIFVAAASIALLVGLAVAVLPWHFVAIGFASLILPAIVALLLAGRTEPSRDWMLVLLLAGLLVLPLVVRLTGANFSTPWQAILLVLSLLGLRRFLVEVGSSTWLKVAVASYAAYMVMGLVSSVLGRSQGMAFLFQLVSNLKPLVLILFGFALLWDQRCERLLWAVIAWAWLPMGAMVAFEWLAPGPFQIYTMRGLSSLSRDPTGLFPSRAISIFEHPSMLAATACSFALLIAARISFQRRSRLGWMCAIVAYVALLAASVQRQEALALIVALSVLLAVRTRRHIFRNLLFGGLVLLLGLAIVWIVFGDNLQAEARLWGVGTVGAIEHPRAQIFRGGFDVARKYLPLGAGLGTYAGAGAEKFDLSLYQDLGFGRYWWFGRRDFLLDTYWPNPIAESGFVGCVLLLVFFLCTIGYAFSGWLRGSNAAAARYWLAALALLIYMFVISFTSPAYQDPRLYGIPAILIGVAATLTRRYL